MNELSYSLHLSSDKNRKPSSKNMAKNNASGSTSLSNNAIQNAKQLSRVDKHNYRKYDNNSELIEIIKGTTSLYEDVKNLYLEEFEDARLEYNKEQEDKGRNDRKITDYFKKISDNTKNDLACEIIIELGDKKYWDTKDDKFKHKMTNVFYESFNRFLIISLDVLICRYSPLFRAFPTLFISEEPHKSFYYPLCFRSQK